MSGPQIRVDGLGMRYGARRALDHVSFEVAAGEIAGLLGPNGAGKTTALSVLAGLFPPGEGTVAVGGFDVVAVPDKGAPPVWARFYDITTNRPIFSGRDSVIKATLAEIEIERRTGYNWYGTWPRELIETQYPAWKQRIK